MTDNDIILRIIQNKIEKDETHESIREFCFNQYGQEKYKILEKEIEKLLEQKNIYREKNKKYWMLICNPMEWYHEDGEYKVNELLKYLHLRDEDNYEIWKINEHTDISLQMKVGEQGIIKVSDDKRSKELRTNKDNEIENILNAGIYGIFEIVNSKDGKYIYKNEHGIFVTIKLIDNYFYEDKNISKEDSINLLGRSVYASQQSREIKKELFEKVLSYTKKY